MIGMGRVVYFTNGTVSCLDHLDWVDTTSVGVEGK